LAVDSRLAIANSCVKSATFTEVPHYHVKAAVISRDRNQSPLPLRSDSIYKYDAPGTFGRVLPGLARFPGRRRRSLASGPLTNRI